MLVAASTRPRVALSTAACAWYATNEQKSGMGHLAQRSPDQLDPPHHCLTARRRTLSADAARKPDAHQKKEPASAEERSATAHRGCPQMSRRGRDMRGGVVHMPALVCVESHVDTLYGRYVHMSEGVLCAFTVR